MDIEKIIGTIDGNPYELYSLRCFLNELIEAGVDLSKNDYNLHPAFIAMEDTYRFNPAVPDSWLVERLFIGETRLEQIYGCYDLRISRKLTDEELNCTQNIGQIRGIQAIDCIFSR